MTIRSATPADAATVHQLILALADYEKMADQVVATEADTRAALAGDAGPKLQVVLAEEDGAAVGFALFFPIYSTFRGNWGMYLEDLYVRPEHRGNGIGYALLQRVAREALDAGAHRLDWVVLDWNKLAIDFYERLGAEPLSDWTTMRLTGDALREVGCAARA
jgi:GNAT superfamily N-acetyltransferase